MKIFDFIGYDVKVVKKEYSSPRNMCLQLVAANTQKNLAQDVFPSEPIATATVNTDITLPQGFALIKDYSENKGVLKALVEAGVVEDTSETYPVGFCEANLVKLLI